MSHFGEYKVEDWYDVLVKPPFTFKTHFLKLTTGQGSAIVHHFEAFTKKSKDKSKYKEEDENHLKDLEKQIDSVIESAFSNPEAPEGKKHHPVFIRLSTRSPKDACLKSSKFRERLQLNLKAEVDAQSTSDQVPPNESMAVIKTLHHCLKVENGAEALKLLCQSERVYTDLSKTLLFMDESLKKLPNHQFEDQMLIIREFDENLNPELEFRAFVRQGNKLTALTQYFKTCYNPYITQNKQTIEQLAKYIIEQYIYPQMLEYCSKTEGKSIEKMNYAIDFAFSYQVHELEGLDMSKTQNDLTDYCKYCRIVELNPFGQSTSAGLFDWRDTDGDAKILKGEAPYECRVLEKNFKTRQEIRDKLSADVRQILDEIEPLPQENITTTTTTAAAENSSTEHEEEHLKEEKKCIIS